MIYYRNTLFGSGPKLTAVQKTVYRIESSFNPQKYGVSNTTAVIN